MLLTNLKSCEEQDDRQQMYLPGASLITAMS